MKRLILLYYLITLFLQPVVFAQEAEPTTVNFTEPTSAAPQEEQSTQPTDTPAQHPISSLPAENQTSDQPSPLPIPSPSTQPAEVSTPEPALEKNQPLSATATSITASSSAIHDVPSPPPPSPTPSQTLEKTAVTSSPQATISTTNTVSHQKTALVTVETGSNSLTSETTATLSSAPAVAAISSLTEVNTTLIGNQTTYHVTTLTEAESPLEVKWFDQPCDVHQTTLNNEYALSNTANININLEASALTGANHSQAAGENRLTTGDARTTAQVATVANTTLIGDCWLYQVVSLFSPHSQTLVLPNEEQFILPIPLAQASPITVETTNAASVSTTVTTRTHTGNNVADGIQDLRTGSSVSDIETVTEVNTTRLGSSWVLVKIVNPQYWKGRFVNSLSTSQTRADGLYYWLSPTNTAATASIPFTARIDNQATLNTQVQLAADTGNNQASGSSGHITTGMASVEAEVLNVLNTTIIGSRWYYIALYLFDDFSGDIQFARPDLALEGPSQLELKPGETTTFFVQLVNRGRASGRNLSLTSMGPTGWQITSPLSSTEYLSAQNSTSVAVTVNAPSSTSGGKYWINFTVGNSLGEETTDNNTLSIPIKITSSITSEPSSLPSHSSPTYQNKVSFFHPFDPQHIATRVQPRRRFLFSSLAEQQTRNLWQSSEGRQSAGSVAGSALAEDLHQLRIPLPEPTAGAFCKKHWEVCLAAGLLLLAGPTKVIERRQSWFRPVIVKQLPA